MKFLERILNHAAFRAISALCILLPATLLTACSFPRQYNKFNEEAFASTTMYSRSFPGTAKSVCEAARRALLGQGYVIDDAPGATVRGHKNFQPENDIHLQVTFNIACADNSKGSQSATVFASAVNDRYTLRKNSNSASVGVGAFGSLSLPFGSSDDAMVKVGSETVAVQKFYDGFFEQLEGYLDTSSDPEAAHKTSQTTNTT